MSRATSSEVWSHGDPSSPCMQKCVPLNDTSNSVSSEYNNGESAHASGFREVFASQPLNTEFTNSKLPQTSAEILYPQGFSIWKNRAKIKDMVGLIDEIDNIFTRIKKVAGADDKMGIVEGLTSRVEALFVFVVQISTLKDTGQIFLATVQYLKTCFKGSILFKLRSFVEEILCKSTAGVKEVFSLDKQSGTMLSNWEKITKGAFGKRISSLLNLCVLCGLMPEKADTFLQKDFYRTFNVKVNSRSSLSIFEHICNAYDYVVDCVYPFITTGEVWRLVDSVDTKKLDESYRKCLSIVDMHTTGQDTRLKKEHNISDIGEIIVFISETQAKLTATKARCDPSMSKEITQRLIKLDKLINDIHAGFHDSAIRHKPFSILIRGASSQAKSTLTQVASHIISQANGFPEGEEYSCTINGSDKYQSELKPQHVSVTFDDMGNTRPERETANPLFVLIQFINNVHCSALSAVAERKGMNDIRAKMVFVTTNTKDLHSWYFSMNPSSIMRRFDLVLDVSVPARNRDSDGKILSKFEGNSMPDMWEIDFFTVGLTRMSKLADKWYEKPVPISQDGKSNRGGIIELANYLNEVTPKYYASQKKIVGAAREMHKQAHCSIPGHELFTLPCALCARTDTGFKCPELKGQHFPVKEFSPYLEKDADAESVELQKHAGKDDGSFVAAPASLFESASTAFHTPQEDNDGVSALSEPSLGTRFQRLQHIMDDEHVQADFFEGANVWPVQEAPIVDVIPTKPVEKNIKTSFGTKSRFPKPKMFPRKTHWMRRKLKKMWKQKKPTKQSDAAENFMAFASRPVEESKRPMLHRVIGEKGMSWEPIEEVLSPKERMRDFAQGTSASLELIKQTWKTTDAKYKVLVAIGAMLGVGLVARRLMNRLDAQGAKLSMVEAKAMTPTMVSDHKDVYKKNYVLDMAPSPESISMSRRDFETLVDRHVRVALLREILPDGSLSTKESFCNAFPCGGGDWLFPGHALECGKKYDMWLLVKSREIVGSTHIHYCLDDTNVSHHKKKDIARVRILKGGNWQARKYMSVIPQTPNKGDIVSIYYRPREAVTDLENTDFSPSDNKIVATVTSVTSRYVKGVGNRKLVSYQMPDDCPSEYGMCGAMVVMEGNNPIILGVHTAGHEGIGACTTISRSEWDEMEPTDVCEKIHIAEDSPLPDKVQGKPIVAQMNVHGRNASNWMEKSKVHSYEFLGTTSEPNARFKTNIKRSCIADALELHLGVKKEHSGPDKKAVRKARHKDLDAISRDRGVADPTILAWAKADLMMKIRQFLSQSHFKDHVHPISLKDALSGVDEVQGVDPINVKTSIGYPLNKKKFHFLVRSPLAEEYGIDTHKLISQVENPDGTVTLKYDVVFDKEKYDIEELLEELLQTAGESKRINVIFSACLKDEALSLEKVSNGKIRVFAGAPTTLVAISRMLTLTLLAMKKEVPTVFESAVGINAKGKDWEFLYNYLIQHGKERMIEGDFKEYDKATDSMFSLSSMEIVKTILKECGYDDEVLQLFDGVATEICLPIYEMEGTLIKADRSVPSGHPWTVDLNGFNNSLYMRYAYYANYADEYPDKSFDPVQEVIPLFHENVSLITYGDDNLMGVSEDEPLLTHASIAHQLEKIGMVYTTADKSEGEVDFIHADEMSFLKRKFSLHDDLGAIVAPLEKGSINKSLTCTMYEKGRNVSDAMIMAGNMRVAQFELFLHGKEEYEKYSDAFDKMSDVEDSQGNKIGTYYKKMSYEDCITEFERSPSRYEKNLEEYNVPLEQHSGSVEILPDYRGAEFEHELISFWNNVQRVHRQKRRNTLLVKQMWYGATTNAEYLFFDLHWSGLLRRYDGQGSVRAYNLIQKLHMSRSLWEWFPSDIVDYISEFAKDKYVHYVMNRDYVVMGPYQIIHCPLDYDSENEFEI